MPRSSQREPDAVHVTGLSCSFLYLLSGQEVFDPFLRDKEEQLGEVLTLRFWRAGLHSQRAEVNGKC